MNLQIFIFIFSGHRPHHGRQGLHLSRVQEREGQLPCKLPVHTKLNLLKCKKDIKKDKDGLNPRATTKTRKSLQQTFSFENVVFLPWAPFLLSWVYSFWGGLTTTQGCDPRHTHIVPKIFRNFLHKNRACHVCSGCNGICIRFILHISVPQTTHINRCIGSKRDWHGF